MAEDLRHSPERGAAATTLSDYWRLLGQRDSNGELLPIVGGQAVNFWAGYYLPREPALRAFRPFVSKDLDVFGSRAEAARIARDNGWVLTPSVVGDTRAAEIHLPGASGARGVSLKVEFLESILGLDPDLVRKVSRVVVDPELRQAVRVLNPVDLLAAKMRNAVDLDQTGTTRPLRQDVRHVQMLALCCPWYLHDLITTAAGPSAEAGDSAAARAVTPALLLLGGLARSYRGRAFETAHPGTIDWTRLVPTGIGKLPDLTPEARQALDTIGRATQTGARRVQEGVSTRAAAPTERTEPRIERARRLLEARDRALEPWQTPDQPAAPGETESSQGKPM